MASKQAEERVSYARSTVLKHHEEIVLMQKAKAGDQAAKDLLIEHNMRLVCSIARYYYTPLLPEEDLVQEGAIGLMTAFERFDPAKGYKFSTYAIHWVRQAISRAIDNHSRIKRVPAHVSEAMRKIVKVRNRLHVESGEEPSLEQVAQALGANVQKLRAFIVASSDPISLDEMVGDRKNTSRIDRMALSSESDPATILLQKELRQVIDDMLSSLKPKQREVIEKRLALHGGEPLSKAEIGRGLHIGRERIRQIEVEAKKRLRFIATNNSNIRELILEK